MEGYKNQVEQSKEEISELKKQLDELQHENQCLKYETARLKQELLNFSANKHSLPKCQRCLLETEETPREKIDGTLNSQPQEKEKYLQNYSTNDKLNETLPKVTPTFIKRMGVSDMRGEWFEIKVALFLFLKGLFATDGFYLATNVADAGAFDDIVLKYACKGSKTSRTVFLQLKHKHQIKLNDMKEKQKSVIKRCALLAAEGPFSLRKLYASYCDIRKQFSLEESNNIVFDGEFENCEFILYTNAKVETIPRYSKLEGQNGLLQFFSSTTNENGGNSFERDVDKDIYKLFTDLAVYKNSLEQCREDFTAISERIIDFEYFRDIIKNKNILEEVERLKQEPSKTEKLIKLINQEIETIGDMSVWEEFLAKMKMITNQASEDEMDDHVKKEIEDIFGTCIQRTKDIYSQLKDGMHDWWKNCNYFLTDYQAPFWFDVVKSNIARLSEKKLKEIRSFNIKFKEDELTTLRAVVPQSCGILHIKTTGTVGANNLSCLKVHQCLLQVSHMLMNNRPFLLHQREVLKCWRNRLCDVLIVADDNCGCMETVIDSLSSNPGKILILITGLNVSNILTLTHTTFYDNVQLEQLDMCSNERLMALPVKFQGFDVSFGAFIGSKQTVENSISVDVIYKLLQTDGIEIGRRFTECIDYYIPRTLENRCHVKVDVMSFPESHSSEIFAVSGIFEFELRQLVSDAKVVLTFDKFISCNANVGKNTDEHYNNCSIILIENEHNFHRLSQFYKVVHWLHYENKLFKWKCSSGEVDLIRNFLDDKNTIYENLNSVFDLPQRLVVLSAEPGMGKTTLLTHLVVGTKHTEPANWVIKVNLNDYSKQLSKLPENITLENITEFLLEVSDISLEFKELFMKKIMSMENVCVLFDGYDEISTELAEKVLNILTLLLDTKIRRLWITTRPFLKEKLEKSLATFSFSLRPFSESDQINFLTQFWTRRVPEINAKQLRKFLVKILELFTKSLNDTERKITGIPLQTMLLAEAFEENVRILSVSGDITLPIRLDLLQLFDRFVERMLSIYFEKNKVDITKSGLLQDSDTLKGHFLQCHMNSALITLLPGYDIGLHGIKVRKKKCAKFKILFSKNCKRSNKLENNEQVVQNTEFDEKRGIIQEVVNGKPIFIHRSFSEYFVAQWFVINYKAINMDFKEKLLEPNFQVVATFLNRILSQNFDLHRAILNYDKDLVQTLLSTENISINAQDDGGRTPLHIAVLNFTNSKNDAETKLRNQIVNILLENHADINLKDYVFCLSPVLLAEKVKAWSVLDLFLKIERSATEKVYKNRNFCRKKCLQEILSVAAKEGLTELTHFLVASGLNLKHNIVVTYGCNNCSVTMMHEAIRHGHLRLVEFLIQHKADMEARDNSMYGRTPLMWAAEHGQSQIVQHMVTNGANAMARDEYAGNTAIVIAAVNGKWDVVKILLPFSDLTAANDDGNTILHWAARSGNADIVKLLLENDAHVNCCNKRSETPLHWAIWYGQLEITKYLLENGADLNIYDVNGHTPLHRAAQWGRINITKYLIKCGADLNACDLFGRTPQCLAIASGHSLPSTCPSIVDK